MVVLEGEAGIGKTFLLEEALDRAEALGFRCFIGGAEELEQHRPFGAISESLRIGRRGRGSSVAHPGENERLARIAGLLAGDAGAAGNALLPGAPEAQFRIVDALIDFVEHLCSGGPVVVALEDLQWSDPSTLLALNRLGREIPRLPAVLIATLRPLPRSADLQVLLEGLAARGAVQLTLGRLDEEAVATLVETLLGARPGAGLLGQVARAGGNPFYVTELVASLQREGAVTMVDDVAEVTEVALPSSLSSTILQRLSFLSEEALETLQVASILGSSFSMANLAVAVGKHAPALTPILASAFRAGILGVDGRLLVFRDDLIRDVLYQSIPAAVRDWLHLAAAHFLAEAGRPYEELAEHVVRGAAPGDVHAIEWLWTAARQAAPRSPAVAVELLERALELVPPSDPQRDAAQADLALCLLRSGHPQEAQQVCREVLGREHDPSLEGRLRQCLIEGAISQGQIEQGLREVEEAIEAPSLMDLDCLEAAQATLLHWRQFRRQRGAAWNHPTDQFVSAIGYFWSGEWNLAITALQMGVDLADTTGIRRGTLVGHSLRALIAVHQG